MEEKKLKKESRTSTEGIGDEGFGTKVFPKELMRRRWSIKEILTIVHDELGRDGKLKQKIQEMIKGGDKK